MKMQLIIGWVLRIGVLLSMAVIFIGGLVYMYRHGQTHVDYSTFKGVPDFIHTTNGIISGIFALKGRAIIQAGIILLITTPVIRVMVSAVGFALERDWLYTFITLLVLMILLTSIVGGHAG